MKEKKLNTDEAMRKAVAGTWRYLEDSDVEYTVSFAGDICEVSGFDLSDGEKFVISDVRWDGHSLRFHSLMPSTNYDLKHIFRVVSDTEIDHEFSRTERWCKTCENEEQKA